MLILCCQTHKTKNSAETLTEKNIQNKNTLDYNFHQPNKTITLNSALSEISGLCYNNNLQSLVTVNDEKGNIYFLNPDDGEIIDKIKFSNNGDYEGIEYLENHIWVLKSNGKLYHLNLKNNKIKDYDTKLSQKNDTEGLCFDKNTKKFLIACKGNSLDESDKRNTKVIYCFNPKKNKLSKKPFLKIHHSKLTNFLKVSPQYSTTEIPSSIRQRTKYFAPSGLAIHPLNGDIYILSARGSMLVIYRQKKIHNIIFFDPKELPQPEGICFDDSNNLFISTEGKNKKAALLVFEPIQ